MKDLNKLLAEWVGWNESIKKELTLFGVVIGYETIQVNDGEFNPMESHDQIHRYLLPKVAELKLFPEFIVELDYILQPESVVKRYRSPMQDITLCSQTLRELMTASAPDICQAIAQAAGLIQKGID